MILYIFANLTKNQNSIPSKNGNGMLEISFIAIFESIPVSVLRSKSLQGLSPVEEAYPLELIVSVLGKADLLNDLFAATEDFQSLDASILKNNGYSVLSFLYQNVQPLNG